MTEENHDVDASTTEPTGPAVETNDEFVDTTSDGDDEDTIDSPADAILLQPDVSIGQVRRAILERFVVLGGGKDDDSMRAGKTLFGQASLKAGTLEHSLAILETHYSSECRRAIEYIKGNPQYQNDRNWGRRYFEEGATKALVGPRIPRVSYSDTSLLSTADMIEAFEMEEGEVINVPLANSCITINIRQPTVAELDLFVTACRKLEGTYGGNLGCQYFMMDDFLITRATVEFIIPLITDTSVKNWPSGDLLQRCIVLHDLDHILAVIASRMYPDGFSDFYHICPPSTDDVKQGCGHETKTTVDIRTLIHTRFSAMHTDVISFLAKSSNTKARKFTYEEVQAHREKLGFSRQLSAGNRVYHFQPPSLFDYLEVGAHVHASILADIQEDNAQSRASIVDSRLFRFFLPWVSKVESVTEKNGELEVKNSTDDKAVITYLLDRVMTSPELAVKFEEQITKLVDDSKLTSLYYEAPTCRCGYKAGGETGITTVDAKISFFTLAAAKFR